MAYSQGLGEQDVEVVPMIDDSTCPGTTLGPGACTCEHTPTTRSVFKYLNRRRVVLYLSRPVLGEKAIKAFDEYWAVVQALDIVGDILDRESANGDIVESKRTLTPGGH